MSKTLPKQLRNSKLKSASRDSSDLITLSSTGLYRQSSPSSISVGTVSGASSTTSSRKSSNSSSNGACCDPNLRTQINQVWKVNVQGSSIIKGNGFFRRPLTRSQPSKNSWPGSSSRSRTILQGRWPNRATPSSPLCSSRPTPWRRRRTRCGGSQRSMVNQRFKPCNVNVNFRHRKVMRLPQRNFWLSHTKKIKLDSEK